MTSGALPPARLGLIGFVAILLVAWVCYRPALNGAFQLDDVSNLAGLASIEDRASAFEFVVSGTAGPSGRPLALMTFALQAGQWDQGARSFVAVNIAIHLLNAMLLAACLLRVSLAMGTGRDRSVFIATIAAGAWVVMPLLASASLLVVQRMTTLSATFSLLGLLGYLLARGQLDAAPRRALQWMSISLLLGTLLATLSKEVGMLLPVYVLALEATVLARPGAVRLRQWRAWQGAFLVLPLVVVLVTLLMRVSYPEWTVAKRGFTGWERLLSELPLLWLYLKKALLGLPGLLGVYQTPPGTKRSLLDPAILAAAAAWLAAIAAAIIWRRRWPLLGLAVFWYLGGHLLESTVMSLELYFEHRNYLPIVGPVFAAVAVLVTGSSRVRRLATVVIPIYLGVSALCLYTFASLSGDPSTSSRYWAFRYPDSVRAVTTMASYQLVEEGPLATLATLDQFVIRQPQHAYLRIQELNLRCRVIPAEDHSQVIDQLRSGLPAVDFTYTATTMLSQLMSTVSTGNCWGVNLDTVAELAGILRDNPKYVLAPKINEFHHKLLASIARHEGDLERTIAELEAAKRYRSSRELNMMMVTTLAANGDFDAARDFIDEAVSDAPRHPLRAIVWRRELENLREYADELERYSRGETEESGS